EEENPQPVSEPLPFALREEGAQRDQPAADQYSDRAFHRVQRAEQHGDAAHHDDDARPNATRALSRRCRRIHTRQSTKPPPNVLVDISVPGIEIFDEVMWVRSILPTPRFPLGERAGRGVHWF